MKPFFQTVRDLDADRELIRSRPYGMIEIRQGRLTRVQLKPWPKFGSIVEAKWISSWRSSHGTRDLCRLFYNQPFQHRNYLVVSYIESTFQTRWKSISAAVRVLNRIAFLKRSDAILAEVTNDDISDRLLSRLGWERHLEQNRKRHFIKRFYGDYPQQAKRNDVVNADHQESSTEPHC